MSGIRRIVVAACLWPLAAIAWADIDLAAPPIRYFDTAPDDAVSELQGRLDAGETSLRFEPHFGYLQAVLRELKVPVASQALVFSKTSLQVSRISPQSPRAIYFNDDTYVGWMPGGHIEISTVDPRLGATFYLLEQAEAARPRFIRHDHECLQCHGSVMTDGVPGHVVRSVATGPDGTPVTNGRAFLSGHASPLHERWGGWYVTGEHGRQRHLGNAFTRQGDRPVDLDAGANRADLRDRFNTLLHLSGHSDIVALMVMEHQVTVHNALARASLEIRIAEHRAAEAAGDPDAATELAATIGHAAEAVVAAMLLADEAPLTDAITGSSGFTRKFARRGPFDSQGRSLREFDLETRLFTHPCSYLIYARCFQELPRALKQEAERQLDAALAAEASTGPAARLTVADRQAIREILADTLPGQFSTGDSASH